MKADSVKNKGCQEEIDWFGWVAQSAVANIPQGKPCGKMLPFPLLPVAALTASLVKGWHVGQDMNLKDN